MREINYNRDKAVNYAHKWAYLRNPKYYSFEGQGGDCTNFISQCIYSGSGVMNYGKLGWFYNSPASRSPSWSGVEFLCNFLTANKGVGPYAIKTGIEQMQPGDIIQLKLVDANLFGHSLLVVSTGSPPAIENILITTHTLNSDNRPLSSYNWSDIRFLHIQGNRKW